MNKPNIILIMTDQMRGDCLGADGNSHIETPNLDFLAAQGTRLRHAYTACPSCTPSRATIMTGMEQWQVTLENLRVMYHQQNVECQKRLA